MVVTVSVIFAMCWMSGAITYLVALFSPVFGPGDVAYVTESTVVMFNSAVNPIVYALVNQQFSRKIKYMMCCGCRSIGNWVHPAREKPNTQHINEILPPMQQTGDTRL